jgi:hypothetical protein
MWKGISHQQDLQPARMWSLTILSWIAIEAVVRKGPADQEQERKYRMKKIAGV